jgi:hypothetical protein
MKLPLLFIVTLTIMLSVNLVIVKNGRSDFTAQKSNGVAFTENKG